MALCRTVGLTLKSVLVNPCFVVPSSVNIQVRHAARKGYRERKRQKKGPKPVVAPKIFDKGSANIMKFEKTVNLKKPEPPNDDVFIIENFNHKKYPLSEIIRFHKEYHHPTVYNNPNVPVTVRIEIDMTGKKQTQVIKPFSGVAAIPHPFVLKHKKEVLVFCLPEDQQLALDCGAGVAGGPEIIKKIQEGLIQPSLFNYIICHTNFLPQLMPLRSLFKEQMPRAKSGTVTNDLKASIYRFLHGIEYFCQKSVKEEKFGVVVCSIGTLDMEEEHLEGNFKALIEDVEKHRPPRDGEFITWIWCTSPPSPEEFLVDSTKYVQTNQLDVDDDDDDDDAPVLKESEAIQALRKQYDEEKMLN